MERITAFSAEEYDARIVKTIPFWEEIQGEVLDVIRHSGVKVKHWLDVGCGTGQLVQRAKAVYPAAAFTLCDIDAEMLAFAKALCGEAPGMEYLKGDIQNIALSGRYSAVTAVQVLQYLRADARQNALKKIYAALEDGGIFISVNNTAPYTELGEETALNRWRAFQLGEGIDEAAVDAHLERYGKDYFPVTLSAQIDALYAAGFKAAEVFWLSYLQAGVYAIK